MKMAEFASKGVAGSGLGLGIAGTALGLLNGMGGNFLGGWAPYNYNTCGNMCGRNMNCFEQNCVSQHELKQSETIASKDSQIALLEAKAHTDKELEDVYTRLNTRLVALEKDVAVNETKITDNLAFLDNKIGTTKNEILCYVNATFVPGELVMPLDKICPPAKPLCNPKND